MLKIITSLVFYCILPMGKTFPFAAPGPLPVSPVAPILPVSPFAVTQRPLVPGLPGTLVPGLPGYKNPYYNQYNRVAGVAGAAVPILTYSSEHTGDGSYAFSFSTADGKQAQESGYLKDAYIDNAGEPQGTQVVQGSYAYISPEGTPIQVNYIADENGFRPSGVHIPADGKSTIPFIAGDKQSLVDPLYNRYDPFTARSRYLNGNLGRYDPRYPYDAAKYTPYNQFNPYIPPGIPLAKSESKKST